MKPHVPGRLRALGLVGPPRGSLGDVVRHLCAVQAQLHDMALWGVARRVDGATQAGLAAAFDAGDVVRTHVLRPTWHLVAAEDLAWLQAVSRSRVEAALASTNRSIGLTEAQMHAGADLVVATLDDGAPRTRAELAAVLAEADLPATGTALAHHVACAELIARIGSGGLRGRQHTYRRLPDPGPQPPRDELLVRLARRYVAGHGPIRDVDLAWWASLTLTDARHAIAGADLRPLDLDGVRYWGDDTPVEEDAVPEVMLLPNFDEYISYSRDEGDYARLAQSRDVVMRSAGLVVARGHLVGLWTRRLTRTTAVLEVTAAPTAGLTAAALEREVQAYGRYVERRAELVLHNA